MSPEVASARPLVFIEKVKGASRLAAVDALAVTLGLEPGLTLADARARIPALKAVALDPAADQAFLARLAETAYAFTPSVAFEPPHGLVLDITGCAHLFDGEAGLLARLEAALWADGVSVVTYAIAPTPEMARALARFASAAPAAHSEQNSAAHQQSRFASGASVALEARLRHDTPRRRDTLRITRLLSEDDDNNGAQAGARILHQSCASQLRPLPQSSHQGTASQHGPPPQRGGVRGGEKQPAWRSVLTHSTPPLIANDNTAVRALPVAALEGDPEDMRALRRAGLKTIGDVASRPSVLFTTRFSPAFTRRLARVLGEEDRRITPLRPPPVTTLDHRCPEPILTTDVVLLILGDLIARTVRLLEERGEGGRLFEAAFFRTDGVIRRLRIETSRPAREAALVLRLVRDRLDALADPLDPGFGFDLVRLEVLRAEPWAPAQASLDANAEAEEQLAGLVDRLGAMFGRARVQRLVAADTHIPERAQRLRPAAETRAPAAQSSRRPTRALPADRASARTYEGAHRDEGARKYEAWPPSMPGASAPGDPIARPLHLFERPQPIEMELRSWGQTHGSDPAANSTRFCWRRVVHDVVRIEGPERIVDEWWRQPVIPEARIAAQGYGTRDYYRVETRDGRRFWIFRAHADEDPAALNAWPSQVRATQGEGPCPSRSPPKGQPFGNRYDGQDVWTSTDEPRWFLHGVFA